MSGEELREALLAVPGVAWAEVTERPGGAPLVRLWLDGTRDGKAVQRDVDHVIALRGFRRRAASADGDGGRGDATPSTGNGRRAGLGKGLDTLIPVALEEATPSHLQEVADRPVTGRLAKLAVEESLGGVVVRAIDAAGRDATAEVGEGEGDPALLAAVTNAVAGLHGFPFARLLAVDERALAGCDVVTVVVGLGEDETVAGAAVVRGGRPFTVAQAVDAALDAVG